MLKLFIVLFPLINFASAVTCVDSGKIKAVIGGKEMIEKVSYCIGQQGLYFLDKKCHQNKQCMAYSAVSRRVDLRLLHSSTGDPSFKLCHFLKGHAYPAHFWASQRWNSIGICSFGDGSFIGTDHLYKKVIQK